VKATSCQYNLFACRSCCNLPENCNYWKVSNTLPMEQNFPQTSLLPNRYLRKDFLIYFHSVAHLAVIKDSLFCITNVCCKNIKQSVRVLYFWCAVSCKDWKLMQANNRLWCKQRLFHVKSRIAAWNCRYKSLFFIMLANFMKSYSTNLTSLCAALLSEMLFA